MIIGNQKPMEVTKLILDWYKQDLCMSILCFHFSDRYLVYLRSSKSFNVGMWLYFPLGVIPSVIKNKTPQT